MRAGGIRAWVSRNPTEACLALAAAISAAILIHLNSQLTFVTDEWELLLNRRDWTAAAFLDPFHEHIVLAPTVIYRLLLGAFGMDSALPFQVVAAAAFLASAVLLFVHLRSRVGDWPALLAAILILFLGAAFEDLLFAFQVGYFGSVAAGLGMLIALDRGDSTGDRIACLLVIVSLAFSSLGICFAVGALVQVLLSSRPRTGRYYVALLPIELWVLWWLGWGHNAESDFSLGNLGDAPEFVFDSAAAGITSLFGLATGDGSEPDQPHLIYGQILLVAGVILATVHLRRLETFPRDLAIVVVIALSFWGLTALNKTPERLATSSRYQYPSAIFILLIAGEVLRGVRITRGAMLAGALVTATAAWSGMGLMFREHDERWVPTSDSLKASLSGLEIAGPSGDPSFPVVFSPDISVPLSDYLAVVQTDGSPAYDPLQLAARPDLDRATADTTMATALGLRLTSTTTPGPAAGCRDVTTASPGGLAVEAGPSTLLNRGDAPLAVQLGRFADGLPVGMGELPPGPPALLSIPADGSPHPWRVGVFGPGTLTVCDSGAQ